MKPLNETTTKYEVGVIIGRFQIDELHSEHIKLIDDVFARHEKVLLFLGVSQTRSTRRNPLDYLSRKVMIEETYENRFSGIYPLYDKKYDAVWSKQVDTKIREVFPDETVVLYGSKDSFIPHYKGQFDTIELVPEVMVDATEIRKSIAKKIVRSRDFRRGVIHSCYHSYPVVHAVIDVAILNEDETEVLLGRKHDEDVFRFIGGFADVTDESLEQTVRREAHEETGLAVDGIEYIASMKVRDWRYKSETDRSIMTTFFKAKKISGLEKGADDIAEVKWFKIADLKGEDVVGEHDKLLVMLKNNLNLNS